MAWAGANLGNLGRMGDAALMESCVPSPISVNPDRVICGGIVFAQRAYAMSWPGAALIEDYPTVHSVAQGNQLFPGDTYGLASRKLSLDQAVGGTPATSPLEAKLTGKDMGPVTLVAPLPSITPVRNGQTSNDAAGVVCGINGWVGRNPGLAVAGLILLYMGLSKGGR